MIFVDYLGPEDRFGAARDVVAREVATALRLPPAEVVVRRLLLADQPDYVELWIELSSDEQLYRIGKRLAQRIAAGLRAAAGAEGEDAEGKDAVGEDAPPNVWVMYRVVPRSHAFLNGEPRGRGAPTFE